MSDWTPPADVKRRIVCAALRTSTDRILLGVRHMDTAMYRSIDELRELGRWNDGDGRDPDAQGFVDQYGAFYTRTEAWKIAEAAGQILRRCGGDTTDGGTLFSENLY